MKIICSIANIMAGIYMCTLAMMRHIQEFGFDFHPMQPPELWNWLGGGMLILIGVFALLIMREESAIK